ncbi:head GIN domain-containing protein [Hymenobacter sp. UYCo722]|uniref:head GIN domain-containing protein n=1 Tax=Hymenobacter sp. UYCo722 TaxID=3156335 RepID=UPI003397773B
MKNLPATAFFCLLSTGVAFAQTAPQLRDVASFHAVEVSNGIELSLASGTTQRVEASADDADQLERLKTEVRDGVLKISFDRKLSETWTMTKTRHLRVNVTATSLDALHASSGAKAEVVGAFTTQKLDVEASSGATIKANFSSTDLRAQVSSGGVATLAGSAQRLDVAASSGGVFRGDALMARACEATASSGGDVAVAVQETLTAHASSGGDVRYAGSPRVSKRTSSGGSVRGR